MQDDFYQNSANTRNNSGQQNGSDAGVVIDGGDPNPVQNSQNNVNSGNTGNNGGMIPNIGRNPLNFTSANGGSEGIENINSTIEGFFNGFIIFLVGVLLILGVGHLFTSFVRNIIFGLKKLKKWKQTVILEVSVPKETLEQYQKEKTNSGGGGDKNIELVAYESLYMIMSNYRRKFNLLTWFLGPKESFTLEIVCTEQEVKFWVSCSKKTAEVVKQQLVSTYSKAHIVELKKINFFAPNTVAYSEEFQLETRSELPFKTYKNLESDILGNLTSSMSGLSKEESAGIQLVLVPINNSKWHKSSQKLALQIQQGQNPKEILHPSFNPFKGIGKFIGGIFKEIFKSEDKSPMTQKEEREIDLTGKKQQIQLTPQQQDIIKKLEEKASRPGFIFTLRVVGSALNMDRAKAIVGNITPNFRMLNMPLFNGIKKKGVNQSKSLEYFIFRLPNNEDSSIINTEEINTIWHLPNHNIQTANIKWLLARKPPIPLIAPGPGPGNVYMGVSESRGQRKEIYLKMEDRFRHIYSLGGSGSGKTVTMNNVMLQDIKMGNGICFIDPHGEGVDDILRRIPEERIDDVIVFSPTFTDRPLGLNMLETDPCKPTQKTLVINTLFEIWDKMYDLKKTGGPMFENYMKNAMRLVMSHPESGSTLMEIPKVLVDDDFRSFKLAMCEEEEVVNFWEKEALKAGGDASLENMVPYITSKLAPFMQNDFIRPMIGQQKSVINFRQAMDNKKIILVSLSKGIIGETSAYLIGMIVVGNMLLNGMGRADGLKYEMDGSTTPINPLQRSPFFVYIDEMQNFLIDSIPKALEEIRKYKVGFYLAHQFVKQVVVDGSERIKDSLMANCATKLIFRCGAEDAKMLETEFAPLTVSDIQNPEARTFNSILLVDGQRTTPFNITAKYDDYFSIENKSQPELMEQAEAKKARIINMVKQKYGRDPAEIEKEIKDRSKLLF